MSGIITQNELNDSLNKNERYLHGISYLFIQILFLQSIHLLLSFRQVYYKAY